MASTQIEIVPTILATSPEQYQQFIAAYQGFAKRVQLDISDGQFTPTVTIPAAGLTWPENWMMDIHMMVARPSEHLANLIAMKPHMVIFHAETGEDLLPIFDQLRAAGIKCGVALAKSTYPPKVKSFIEAADHVLIFAGKLGQQGSDADILQTEKVPLITKIKSDIEIGWDGGANMKNVRAIAHTGISVINVGAALATSSNPAATYDELVKEADRKGVAL